MNSTDGIDAAEGPLLVLTVGLGAVTTTFLAGVELVRRGLSLPIGSLTHMQILEPGKRVCDVVPIAVLDSLRFAAWDPAPDSALSAARQAGVLSPHHLDLVGEFLEGIHPMPAVFDRAFVPQLNGSNVKPHKAKSDMIEALRDDIRTALRRHQASRAVMVWCASTEVFSQPGGPHNSAEEFERALDSNDWTLAPSQIYAYAALKEGVPFINAAPNLTVDVPAMVELAEQCGVPICGKDLKTGQTLLKTILAPGLQARMLGIKGWFSINILGNRDGLVLDDPRCFRTKEGIKKEFLNDLLDAAQYPDLYEKIEHCVRINYYPPRGDAKESWDNIDIVGWLGYPMQIKVNFLCRDSILAAPLVLDLVLLADLAKRAGASGVQDWLGFYFKCPQQRSSAPVHNALHLQHSRLLEELRTLAERQHRAADDRRSAT